MEEPTEEELKELVKKWVEFIGNISKEMDGKQTGEILSDDVAMIVSICLTQLYESSPASVMVKSELMNTATLIANSIVKYLEQKTEEAKALEGIWKED